MFESEKLELALRKLFGLMPAKELQKCKKNISGRSNLFRGATENVSITE